MRALSAKVAASLAVVLSWRCFVPAVYADAETAASAPVVTPALTNLLSVAVDRHARNDKRVTAVLSLGRTSFSDCGSTLLSLLDKAHPLSVQLAALSVLDHFKDPEVGPALVKRWEGLIPDVRDAVPPVLLRYPDRATAMLQAIKTGTIPASTLSGAEMEFLRNYRDEGVRRVACEVLPASNPSERQKVVEAYRPALKLKGFVTHGATLFEERCSACHRLRGEGFPLGPDLALAKTNGVEHLLISILDPSREIRPEYVCYSFETKDKESVIGLLGEETPKTVTVRQPRGQQAILNRADIRSKHGQRQSLMPEGLEDGLTAQDIADILEFIAGAEPGGS